MPYCNNSSCVNGQRICKRCKRRRASEITYGDANGDGKIDSRDAVVIKKYVAGFTGFAIDLEASDVNADGKVDTRDAVKILKKIVGFDVTLGEA